MSVVAISGPKPTAGKYRDPACQRAYEEAYRESYAVAVIQSAPAKTERTRIKSILTSADGVARVDMARHLAFATDMTAEAAVALLAMAPMAATAPRDRLDRALASMNDGRGAGADVIAYETGKAIVDRVKGKTEK